MEYFFPGILTTTEIDKHQQGEIPYNFDSASSALRFALKSIGLNKGDMVVIPAFACDSVENAIITDELKVIKLDLKDDATFWSIYDEEIISRPGVKAVLLVHLYGFLHPDTTKIIAFCKRRNIPLIHDLAQCYGVNEEKLQGDDILIYSFGPGKSSVAALGGFVKGIKNEIFYKKHTRPVPDFSVANFAFNRRARLFIKIRTLNYRLSALERLSKRITDQVISRLFKNRDMFRMTKYQQEMALYCMQQVEGLKTERRKRHDLLKEALRSSGKLKIVYSNEDGNYFKTIVYCDMDRQEFAAYLKENKVPHFRLFEETTNSFIKNDTLPNFKKYACGFFEFSTEVSLPTGEVNRVALILKNYK